MNLGFYRGKRERTAVSRLAYGGDGVGKIKDMVTFIPFAAAGDEVEVRITEVRKRYLRGRLLSVLNPSPDRVEPLCRYYTRCGGCQYQHIAYERQLSAKREQVIECFRRIGGFDSIPEAIPVCETIPSPRSYGYRCKAEFHLGMQCGYSAGFMDTSGFRLVDIERCEIVDESINENYRIFRSTLPGREKAGNGSEIFWSGIPFETSGSRPDRVAREVKKRVLAAPYYGFFQANSLLTERLVDSVLEMSGEERNGNVLDCYCGSGLFTVFLAEKAKKIYGIETDPEAAECARANLEDAGFSRDSVLEGMVEEKAGELADRGFSPDVIILDPPRTGCAGSALTAITELEPEKIVYVSCDPATQARDISLLAGRGYRLELLRPIDMFPQTKHIETIAVLKK
ncbi:MAG TPA: class I SAM-dependent RNA methyltransferase [Syntrophales bacterium]|nr:class I SAM-dependent RNA methyltransferase [Syntrophales bacterium]